VAFVVCNDQPENNEKDICLKKEELMGVPDWNSKLSSFA